MSFGSRNRVHGLLYDRRYQQIGGFLKREDSSNTEGFTSMAFSLMHEDNDWVLV